MRDLAEQLLACDERFALATVVRVKGSSPRGLGAAMAVTESGVAIGSISGGCVEAAVYDAAQRVLRDGDCLLETYGVSDEDAFAVGLTCGGTLDVLITVPHASLLDLLRKVVSDEPVALATVVSTGALLVVTELSTSGTLRTSGLDFAVTDDARGMLASGQTGVRHYGPSGERRIDDVAVLVQSFTPPPRLLVFGATDFAAAVARLCSFLGYRVTVCDARPVFATPRRFPDADQVVCEWPDRYLTGEIEAGRINERTVIAVLTHDPKFDGPLLEVALRSSAGYVGAMGSRQTHEDRLSRLRDAGVTEEELLRLHSPIGLDLGARTAEETAVSIAAELVQTRWGGTGRPLGSVEGAIHGGLLDTAR
jgi:xanthine dehydrogenase accessory factor